MYLNGYIRVKVMGENISLFINSCKEYGIELRRVKLQSDMCYIDVKSRDFNKLTSVADECSVEIFVTGKMGLVMKLIIYKSRTALFVMSVLLTLYYAVNYCFISQICINGNNIFSDNQILACLEDNGIYEGRMKFGINPEKVQNDFIMDFPAVSWIWVEIDGTKAIVNLREKVTKPEFYDYNALSNVVAKCDGVITKAVSASGTLLVGEGMFVKKGDILIGGVYDSNELAPIRFVNAEGQIYAKTSYSLEDKFSFKAVRYIPKTPLKNRYNVRLNNIKLYNDEKKEHSVIKIQEKDIKFKIFGEKYLPLAFTKSKYCEIIREEYILSKDDARIGAFNELICRLKLSISPDAKIDKITKNIVSENSDSFVASVTFECIEDIAVKSPIYVDLDSD